MSARILIADDQADVLESLRLLLKTEDYRIDSARSPNGVLSALQEQDFDVVLMDLNYARDTTSGKEGLDLLSRIQELDGTLPVVVMTAWGSVDLAVSAMRGGARDFVQKPWDNTRLVSILRTQVELGRALRRAQRLEAENRLLRADGGESRIVAESIGMKRVMEVVARVGPADANLLITGENGTGKGVVAKALHAVSGRAAKGFDPAAIEKLLDHGWPGNVRELQHAVERGVLMAEGEVIRGSDLALQSGKDGPLRVENMSLEEVETLLIKKAMAKFEGNVSKAAEALGLSRSAMYRRLQRLGL